MGSTDADLGGERVSMSKDGVSEGVPGSSMAGAAASGEEGAGAGATTVATTGASNTWR